MATTGVAVVTGAGSGLAYRISESGYRLNIPRMFAALLLLSLAGIPPTSGFLGKYYIFLALLQTRHYTLAVVATLYVAVAIYYYFKIVRSMFVRE